MKTPILKTERLILRPLTIADAEHIYSAWASCPKTTKYMIFDQHETLQDTIGWLEFEQANHNNDKIFTFGFELKETGELVGSGGLCWENDCFYIGYILAQEYWYKGLAMEASKAMIAFAKTDLGVDKIIGRFATENEGSEKILSRLGFVHHQDTTFTSFGNKKTFDAKLYLLNL